MGLIPAEVILFHYLLILISGLGIGTAVNGLLSHGVETDIVELDPVVYDYAKRYFGLKPNHTAYIEDAISFVKRESNKVEDKKQYEFILHDVFTGGAVPASLFTAEFFTELRSLLTDDGVIAIVGFFPPSRSGRISKKQSNRNDRIC